MLQKVKQGLISDRSNRLANNFYHHLFSDLQKCISARQQLDAQLNENTLVKEVRHSA